MNNTNYGAQLRELLKVFSVKQVKRLLDAFYAGFTDEQINFVANPHFDDVTMAWLILGIKKGIEVDVLKKYINFGKNERYEIFRGLIEDGLSISQVDFYAKDCFDSSQMEEIRLAFTVGMSFDDVKTFAKPEYSALQMSVIKRKKEYFLDEKRLNQILEGIEKGLSHREVYFLLERNFKSDQLQEIILGFLRGTPQEVLVYLDSPYNAEQMREMRLGFENGLTMEQVCSYAKLNYPADKMRKIRFRLQAKRKNKK